MEEEKEEQKTTKEIILENVEKELCNLSNKDIDCDNVDYLYKLIDIHKDLKNEDYWKEKMKMRRYGNYGNYGESSYEGSYGRRGVPGTGRGRYRDSGNYSGRYRGESMLDEMCEAYSDYSESGNYGGNDSMQKLEIMADALVDFVEHIKKNAKTPEERELIEHKIEELSRM